MFVKHDFSNFVYYWDNLTNSSTHTCYNEFWAWNLACWIHLQIRPNWPQNYLQIRMPTYIVLCVPIQIFWEKHWLLHGPPSITVFIYKRISKVQVSLKDCKNFVLQLHGKIPFNLVDQNEMNTYYVSTKKTYL